MITKDMPDDKAREEALRLSKERLEKAEAERKTKHLEDQRALRARIAAKVNRPIPDDIWIAFSELGYSCGCCYDPEEVLESVIEAALTLRPTTPKNKP